MNADPSPLSANPLSDPVAFTIQLQPSSPETSTSPPFADAVVRHLTSQGSTFASPPPQPLARNYSPARTSERPLTPVDPAAPKLGPYNSASARTSYTRVDVDSLSSPVYPPLPSLPTPSADVPAASPTNGAQSSVDTEPPIPQTPQVSLIFLLVSGRRKTQSFDPETTVGRVKELVWNAWPARGPDWQEERPPAPSYFRILYLGKILQDDDTLLRVGFPTSLPSSPSVTPTIVHLSIRPYAPPSEDPALSKKKRLSTALLRLPGGDVEHSPEGDVSGAGCCGGCTIS